MRGLIYGVGVNDANYPVTVRVYGNWRKKWQNCPLYAVWTAMLRRCYSSSYQEKHATYKGCTVCDEWLYFSEFKAWMEKQDWKGKQIDKDILVHGNKIYSPSTCVFVTAAVNNFILESGAARGDWPIGVCWDKKSNSFVSVVRNPITQKQENLGHFDCPSTAHLVWLSRKLELAKLLADQQEDSKLKRAIVARYEKYTVDYKKSNSTQMLLDTTLRENTELLFEGQFDTETMHFEGILECIDDDYCNGSLIDVGCSSVMIDSEEDEK